MQITRMAFYSANRDKFHNICYMYMYVFASFNFMTSFFLGNRKTMPSFSLSPRVLDLHW